MRKIAAILLTVIMLISLSSCSGAGKTTALKLTTGGVSGTYYPYGGAIAQIFSSKVNNVKVTANTSGASAENIRLVGKGGKSDGADLGIVQNDVMAYAYEGVEQFSEGKIDTFRTIATLYPEYIQIVVAEDSGINSIADMKGKRISVGDAGSGVEANAKQILEAYGLTFDDINASHLSFKESGQGLQDKQLDGFFCTAGIPNAAIQEVAHQRPVKILSVDDAQAKQLIEKYPFYVQVTIPKDIYNTENDAKTLAVMATLICNVDLSEELVYNLTKSLFENQAELAAANAKGAELSLEKAVEGASVPFHPGAEKYYKEKGILK
jgi:TRAP transporter TAXI family solute receptor